jgi:hypothetical protein
LFAARAAVSGLAFLLRVALVGALVATDAQVRVWAVNLAVPGCLGMGGAFMISAGLRGAGDPKPGRWSVRQGGCLGSILGAIVFFFLCFWVIPEGKVNADAFSFRTSAP